MNNEPASINVPPQPLQAICPQCKMVRSLPENWEELLRPISAPDWDGKLRCLSGHPPVEMTVSRVLPDVTWTAYPKRRCREMFMMTEHVDLSCDLPDGHPGPPASKGSKLSIERRQQWEADHPGWQRMAEDDDPFVELKP